MSRRHPLRATDRLVRFVCIDRYHDVRPHRVTVLRLGDDGLIRRGNAVREHERPGGGVKWTISCKCGVSQQRDRDEFSRIAAGLFAANPGAVRVPAEPAALPLLWVRVVCVRGLCVRLGGSECVLRVRGGVCSWWCVASWRAVWPAGSGACSSPLTPPVQHDVIQV